MIMNGALRQTNLVIRTKIKPICKLRIPNYCYTKLHIEKDSERNVIPKVRAYNFCLSKTIFRSELMGHMSTSIDTQADGLPAEDNNV